MVDGTGPATDAIPRPALSDGVVVLRAWQPADAPSVLQAFVDPVFERFSDWAPRSEAGVMARIDQQERRRLRGELIDLAIVEAGQPEVAMGGISLNDIDRHLHQRASIGYWLGPRGRGRGLVTRSVKLLSGWAFAELGLKRIELTCGPDNTASQRVAQRCGFHREGLLRSHLAFKNGRRDTVVFSLLAD
ncbi:MAG: GNAT family protein [Micropruina sp.]|uniref:GNAT family N-acetyltransferase n=1 Tax=Micropruina sp. TaxID=2737536 RepID=UPI0039E65990